MKHFAWMGSLHCCTTSGQTPPLSSSGKGLWHPYATGGVNWSAPIQSPGSLIMGDPSKLFEPLTLIYSSDIKKTENI